MIKFATKTNANFPDEMQRRRDFYTAHPEVKPSGLEQRGEASYQHLLTPEETICLSLNYHESSGPPRLNMRKHFSNESMRSVLMFQIS